MLIVEVSINKRKVDKLCIRNTGTIKKRKGVWLTLYHLEDRDGYLLKTAWHERSRGYKPLLKKIL